uniref:Uncharacterized protein n=1 Tax=Chaetoceros debilis TaxID=122233 RepID=A0A7S3VGJ0_9STRA|mmetsp:Transcript_18748/g.28483  ORF Transcript_18748/g.28483 Transcript_18748/m.28483 type:complete len:230 (+) Transcript_18748:85-774(+)
MVVCIAKPCGNSSFESTKDKGVIEPKKFKNLVQQMLFPHFHCSIRPAKLDAVPYEIHPALAALWNEAEEWHLLASDHCDVYGFNVWSPAWLNESTDMVFGGTDGRKKWLRKQKNQVLDSRGHPSNLVSSASKGWVCCIAFSEFDYLVICLDHTRSDYGNLHHINTRHEKESYCCKMDELLLYLVYFIKEGRERKRVELGKSKKSNIRPRSGLPKPLKMLRKAVLDAFMR